MGLSDTVNFLKSLSELDAVLDSGKSAEKLQIRERKAAGRLFDWEVSFSSFNLPNFVFLILLCLFDV